jgi:hypothetical protein
VDPVAPAAELKHSKLQYKINVTFKKVISVLKTFIEMLYSLLISQPFSIKHIDSDQKSDLKKCFPSDGTRSP